MNAHRTPTSAVAPVTLTASSRWRPVAVVALVATLAFAVAPEAIAQSRNQRDRQDAEAAKQGEDNLEQLLGRFGPQHAGLSARIDGAIRKGVDWLLARQLDDGNWECHSEDQYAMGGTALCALAIKKSMRGLYPGDERELKREIRALERKEKRESISWMEQKRLDHLRDHGADEIVRREKMAAAVAKAIEWIRARYDEVQGTQDVDGVTVPRQFTYNLGIILMLLEAHHEPKSPEGGYARQRGPMIPQADLDWVREMVTCLEQFARKPVVDGKTYPGMAWRYPYGSDSTVDHSATQYAILGLKAGARMGVHITKKEIWVEVVKHFIAAQQGDGPQVPRKPPAVNPADGKYFFPDRYTDPQPTDRARGWMYFPVEANGFTGTSGGMTTAALAGLTLARSELIDAEMWDDDPDLARKADQAIADGMAWLGHHFSVEKNPPNLGANWHLYYLYGLERAGVLCQTEFFGTHAWYPLGATFLCDRQKDDGSWDVSSAHGDVNVTDTCFALLFLKRATTPVNAPPVIRPVVTGDGKSD